MEINVLHCRLDEMEESVIEPLKGRAQISEQPLRWECSLEQSLRARPCASIRLLLSMEGWQNDPSELLLWNLYVSKSDDKSDLQGIVCFFFLALCVTFNGPRRGQLTLDWRIYSLPPGPVPICLGWNAWKRETRASPARKINCEGPACGSTGKGCKLANNK